MLPQAWNATATTSTDAVFNANDFETNRVDLALLFVASGDFWFYTGDWADGVTNAATLGTEGRGSKLPADVYSWPIESESVLKFRSITGSVNFEGVVVFK